MNPKQRVKALWQSLYPQDDTDGFNRLELRLHEFAKENPAFKHRSFRFTEKDSILITYGDQIQSPETSALDCLRQFLLQHIGDSISCVHLLPFFPYSSDDGFSVINYTKVDNNLGDWSDINSLGQQYHLMFDFVLNHISRSSEWFQKYIQGDRHYRDFFITVEPGTDLSSVVRPRALPLLTPVETDWGKQYVWTTFSTDQIDLNYANPDVALAMIDVLLIYIKHGAEIVRMDAIAYLWKEIGTSSIHLPQTHRFVKLLRAVLDLVAPGVVLITETNVPHEENISYFGAPLPIQTTGGQIIRSDEAQMVYQFSLAPLVLHTFLDGECSILSRWVGSLANPVGDNTFFNFIASHDGIGVRPAEGLLSHTEIQALIDRTRANGGQVSYKQNADGSQSPYELNITLYDFLNDPHKPNPRMDLKRFMASQAIMLSLAGVPGIYFHSLFGSSNCQSCLEETGRARSLNREKFTQEGIRAMLQNQNSRASRVLNQYTKLLDLRQNSPAFSPHAEQHIIPITPEIFGLYRSNSFRISQILVMINVTDHPAYSELDLAVHGLPDQTDWRDIITGSRYPVVRSRLHIETAPYQILWLQPG